MKRIESRELENLRKEGATIYSFSRLECINRCSYEAYLTYIKKQKGRQNIYAILGGRVHDILEGITNGKNTESDLLPAIEQELNDCSALNIEFPSDSIKDNWIKSMHHFAKDYKHPRGKNLTAEMEVLIKSPKGRPLVGYIDLIKENKDGSLSIYDFKSSSLYKGSAIQEHARQIILYGLALEDLGYIVRDVSWIFLKYIELKYQGYKTARSKEKTEITKVIERKDFGKTISSVIEKELISMGWDEIDTQFVSEKIVEENSLDIPGIDLKDVIEKLQLKTKPYVLAAEYTDESKKECLQYIDNTIDYWENLKEYKPLEFITINSKGNKNLNDFFCRMLCPHGEHCDYIKEFLDKQAALREGQDDEDLW